MQLERGDFQDTGVPMIWKIALSAQFVESENRTETVFSHSGSSKKLQGLSELKERTYQIKYGFT